MQLIYFLQSIESLTRRTQERMTSDKLVRVMFSLAEQVTFSPGESSAVNVSGLEEGAQIGCPTTTFWRPAMKANYESFRGQSNAQLQAQPPGGK